MRKNQSWQNKQKCIQLIKKKLSKSFTYFARVE